MKYLCSSAADKPADEISQESPSNLHSSKKGPDAAQKPAHGDDGQNVTQAITVARESHCHPFLKRWAGSSELIVASFYFWNLGEEIQMTWDGLVRTLLHKILVSRPDLIALIAPADWESACLLDHCQLATTAQELQDLLIRAIQSLKDEVKICCFIDGLDEFGDNHEDLISLVQNIIGENKHVKLCVASRPWTIFQTAFDQQPSLQLEDLTHDDIIKFVRSKFHANAEFESLRQRYPYFADQLIENIVAKASGVFLWVDIVVNSLLAGMRLGDRIQDFQRRLDELPPDLERLYDKILHNLDPFYLDHAAQYFALVEQAEEPLTILQLSFADEDTADSAINMPLHSLTDQQISLRAEAMSKRLNNRCKGFLEVDRGWQNTQPWDTWRRPYLTVQYLHRTVRDYIKSQKANDFLKSSRDPKFDVAAELCVAYVLDLKTSSDWRSSVNDNLMNQDLREPLTPLHKCITRFFRQAALAKDASKPSIADLIADLQKLVGKSGYEEKLSQCFEDYSKRKTLTHPWKHSLEDADNRYLVLNPILQDDGRNINDSFLSLAVALGITSYVKLVAPDHGLIRPFRSGGCPSYPLLLIAVSVPMPNPAMVQCLLDINADPNFEMTGRSRKSPWFMALHTHPWALKILTDPAENARAEILWREAFKLLYGGGGYLAKVPDAMLDPITRRMLGEVRKEMDPMRPTQYSILRSWFVRT